MKPVKINLSKILKFLLISVLNIFFIFVFQYYIGFREDLNRMSYDLKAAVFVDASVEDGSVLSELGKFTDFSVVEYVSRENSYKKTVELNPELSDIVPDNTVSYPAYVIVNRFSAVNKRQMESVAGELTGLEFVSDVVYDAKAFEIYFKDMDIFLNYKKIAYVIASALLLVFVIKLVFFVLKKSYVDILFEILSGGFSAVFSYFFICVSAAVTHNSVFVLDWHILLILIPLGSVISFATKESNV